MDNYYNLIILQPGSTWLARATITAILITYFYFILEYLKEIDNRTKYLYYNRIKYKEPVKLIISAFQGLYPDKVDFVTDTELLGIFNNIKNLYSIYKQYLKSIYLSVYYPSEISNIYTQVSRQQQ